MTYAKQVDRVQSSIVKTLRQLGCSVFVTSATGNGFPDLVVGRNGMTYLVELKSPGGSLTPMQKEFHQLWKGGKIHVIHSPEEAIDLFRTANKKDL